jgi:hypothetical protein
MRSILIIVVLVFVTLISHAQEPRTVINCYIRDGKVNYGHLAVLLPDSIQANLLIDPREKFKMKDGNNILLWLEQQGWTLMGIDITGTGANGNAFLSSTYILSKKIYLDSAARMLFIQKLERIDNKNKN